MILSGWKEIAHYLGRGTRTVQRWEQFGLPVRRPAGHSRSAVSAISTDIDGWLQHAADEPPQGSCSSVREAAATLQAALSEHRRLIKQQSGLREQLANCRRDVYDTLEKIHAGCTSSLADQEECDLPASAA